MFLQGGVGDREAMDAEPTVSFMDREQDGSAGPALVSWA